MPQYNCMSIVKTVAVKVGTLCITMYDVILNDVFYFCFIFGLDLGIVANYDIGD